MKIKIYSISDEKCYLNSFVRCQNATKTVFSSISEGIIFSLKSLFKP